MNEDPRSDVLIGYVLRQRLEDLPRVPDRAIGVSVRDGRVVLRGRVDDGETRRLAERLARETSGVRAVRNDLEVAS